MLPDFRVVTIAVISTFLFAASVGFYTSSRLASEHKPRPETLAAIEENPLNRIALNWPEPVQPSQNPLDLDFAVTAKAQRNPVRDVTDEPAAAPEPKVAAAPQISTPDAAVEPSAIELPKPEISRLETEKPEVAQIETPRLETITAPPAPPAAAVPPAKPEDDVPTASVVEAPRPPLDPQSEERKQAPAEAAEPQVASRPDPEAPEAQIEADNQPGPAIKPDAPKPAVKKAARKRRIKKAARAIPRPRPRIVTTLPANSFFQFFNLPQ